MWTGYRSSRVNNRNAGNEFFFLKKKLYFDKLQSIQIAQNNENYNTEMSYR